MTVALRHISLQKPYSVSNPELDEIAKRFSFDDDRSSIASIADIAFTQFVIHLTSNTKTIAGQLVNVFDGQAHGWFGMYGDLATVLMKDGKFRLSEDGNLPWIVFGSEGGDASVEFRQNENPVLAAVHLAFMRLHNARMDAHGDEALARREVVGTINKALCDVTRRLTGFDAKEIIELGRKHSEFVNTFEWVSGAGRILHAMVTDEFAGNPLFTKMRAHEVPLHDLLTEDAGKPGLRLAPSMNGGDKTLVRKTLLTRHNEHELLDTKALAKYFDLEDGEAGQPIWSGLLEEADAGWGPIARHALAAGFGSMLNWAGGTEGVYMLETEGVPETLEQVIAYVW